MSRVDLTYVFDAYCGWCYGFTPALHRFAADNASRLRVRVLSGGLFTGSAARPVGDYPAVPVADERIAELTGATFGEPYRRMLADGATVVDSAAAATGLAALCAQRPERALELAAAVQRAWYLRGRDLRDVAVYRSVAVEHGIDADAVATAYANAATRDEAMDQFRQARSLGVSGYPTLLVHTSAGARPLGGATATADELTAALDRQLATTAC